MPATTVKLNAMSATKIKPMKKQDRRYYLLMLIIFTLCSIHLSVKAQTVNEVRTELERLGVKHVDIVLKQSILETGWYKSYNCKTRNNIFGFRLSINIGRYNKYGYLEFDSWQQGCKYYYDWQDRHYNGGDYYTFLKRRGYAEDPNYINKLKKINTK